MSRYFIELNKTNEIFSVFWKTTGISPGNPVLHRFIDVSELFELDFATFNMLYPEVSEYIWSHIGKCKLRVDNSADTIDYCSFLSVLKGDINDY